MENPLKSRTYGPLAPEGRSEAGGGIGPRVPGAIARLAGVPAPWRRSAPAGSGRPYRTYVLLNRVTGLVKVGRSVDVPARVRDLELASGCPLTVLLELAGDRERELHRKLARYRTRGEWFRLPPLVLRLVERVQPAHRIDALEGRSVRPLRSPAPVQTRRRARAVGFARLIDKIIEERRAK